MLLAKGYRVYAVVRPNSRNLSLLPESRNVVPVFESLETLTKAADRLPEHCSAFFHMAWSGVNREEIDSEVVQQKNVAVSLEAAKAAMALSCDCFVFSGSRSEYGRQDGFYSESLACHPMVAYGKAKLEFGQKARELFQDSGTSFVHARIFSTYGADDHPWSLIYTAVNHMLKNEPMALSSCVQKWNFMDVRDAAELLLTFYEQHDRIPEGDSGIFNVATEDIRPLRSFVEEIYEITGSRSELQFGAFQQGEESAVSLLPDMTKVRATFDWEPKICFRDGIRNMIEQLGVGHA